MFLHDSGSEQPETDAAKPVDNQVFFIRFAQRVIHLLTMHSAAGRLYEVDVRLRPSGKGGMLITRIGAFADTSRRKRGPGSTRRCCMRARWPATRAARGVRARARRDPAAHVRRDTLRTEVRDMRERMRKELSRAKAGSGMFDIKQDAGGTADIEFLAQYWALLHARDASAGGDVRGHDPPARIGGLGRPGAAGHRRRADGAYRNTASVHHLSLEHAEPVVAAAEFAARRAA